MFWRGLMHSGDCRTTNWSRLGVAYRRPRWDQVSVVRREAVAALDVRVGPKT